MRTVDTPGRVELDAKPLTNRRGTRGAPPVHMAYLAALLLLCVAVVILALTTDRPGRLFAVACAGIAFLVALLGGRDLF